MTRAELIERELLAIALYESWARSCSSYQNPWNALPDAERRFWYIHADTRIAHICAQEQPK